MASSSQSSRSRTCTPAATTDAALARCPVVPFDDERNEGAHDKEERAELRRGPWTVDEDLALVNYITDHGEGRWNALAPAAGLKRTGKSCRLRWLNYLRPDVKRGDFTADEHLLILDLHSRYGNRWSRIAQHLPGRTDNEIKNYWRTRVQKHAKQLNCDANSQRFKDAMRYLWTPSLVDSHRFLNANAAGSDHQDDGYYLTAALSGVGVTYPSSDSLVTTTSEPHDASFPARKWGELYSYADVRAGEETMAVSSGDWCAARETSQQQAPGMMWPGEQKAAQAVRGAGARFEDPELGGWVQSFSEVVDATESSFWTLDDVWKTQ